MAGMSERAMRHARSADALATLGTDPRMRRLGQPAKRPRRRPAPCRRRPRTPYATHGACHGQPAVRTVLCSKGTMPKRPHHATAAHISRHIYCRPQRLSRQVLLHTPRPATPPPNHSLGRRRALSPHATLCSAPAPSAPKQEGSGMDECPESERRRHARSALQPRAHLGHVFDHGRSLLWKPLPRALLVTPLLVGGRNAKAHAHVGLDMLRDDLACRVCAA